MVYETLNSICQEISAGSRRGNKQEILAHLSDLELISKLKFISAGEFAWRFTNDNWSDQFCKICTNKVKFNLSTRKFATYCSKSCSYADPNRVEKIAHSMMKKYGVRNAANSRVFVEKKKQTTINRYGVDHPSKSQAIKDKKRNSMQDRWGVDNPSQHNDIQQKKINTNRTKRGVNWATQDPAIKTKQKETNLKKYGTTSSLSNQDVQAKSKKTMIEKYGVEYAQQNVSIQSNTIRTNMLKYGVPYPSQNQDIKNKIRETNIEKYGAKSWRASDIGKETLQQIHLVRRGVTNPSYDPYVVDKIKSTMQNRYGVSHINYLGVDPTVVNILQSSALFSETVSGLTVQQVAEKLGIHESTVYRLSNEYNCRSSMNFSNNSYESKITDLLDGLDIGYQLHDRTVISPKEIDIYIKDKRIGIEVGSTYYHGELSGRGKFYHYDKWKLCQEQNITLFQWFDDEIFNYWHLTQSRLLRAIGIPIPVIGARKVHISNCTVDEEQQFLDYWHLKGFSTNRNTVIAARYQGNIVAILTLYHKDNHAKIDRWATDITKSWPGLFSRMLAYWQKSVNFSGKVSTWSDNRLGNGQVYASSGFEQIRVSKPGYWYFKNHGLENRERYQKSKLLRLFDLPASYCVKSEWDIMQYQGYDRLWDAGHTYWVKQF